MHLTEMKHVGLAVYVNTQEEASPCVLPADQHQNINDTGSLDYTRPRIGNTEYDSNKYALCLKTYYSK